MIPELFHIGSLSISPFGPLVAAGFGAGFLVLRRNLKHLGLGDAEDPSIIVFWAMLGGMAGGRIYYMILNRDLGLLFERSGFVWYGGFVLGTAAVVWAVRRRGLPFAATADAALPGLAIGYAIGRVGCFLVGDDYGVPTRLPWGVAFPRGVPPTEAGYLRSEFGLAIPADVPADELLAVHPTQLYETVICLAIGVLGIRLLRSGRQPGTSAMLVLGLLAAERFAVEFLRAKDDRLLGQFTIAQLISVAIFVVAALLWTRLANAPPLDESG